LQERFQKLREASTKRRSLAKIKKLLKRTKVKKVGGKPVGKLTADAQATVELFRSASTKSRQEAFLESQDIIAKMIDPNVIMSESKRQALRLQNEILNKASELKGRSAKEVLSIENRLAAVIEKGAAEAKAEKVERKTDRDRKVLNAQTEIIGDKPIDPLAKRKDRFKGVKQWFRTFGEGISGFQDLMEIITQDATTKEGKSKKLKDIQLLEDTSVFEVEQNEKGGTFNSNQEVVNLGLDAYGFKSSGQLLKKFTQDMRIVNQGDGLGVMPDASGKEVRMDFTTSEIRKMFMEWQDPDIRASIQSEEGGYILGDVKIFGVTDQMADIAFSHLSQEDKKFARSQMDFYKDLYKRINAQYRKDFGVDLPFNEFYSPIRRTVSKKNLSESFFEDIGYRQSQSPAFVKSRVENREFIKVQSDIVAMQNHIVEMEHYLAWSDKLKDLNAIFSDGDVRLNIKSKFGDSTMTIIDKFIMDFKSRGLKNSVGYEKVLASLRKNYTVSALALKPALTAKQMVSVLAYLEDVSLPEFIGGLTHAAFHPLEVRRVLNKSDLLKTRGGGIDRDLADIANSKEFKLFQKNPSFKNMLLITTRIGDRGAIMWGGWAVYRAELKRTGSEAKAIKAFEKSTQRTQQSSDLSQLSDWQRGNEFQKMFTMFTTSQNQYFRREVGAIRNLISGKITLGSFAKKIAIYHFLLPTFFQFVANAGNWDEEEQKRAAILGSLNGIFILGDMLDWAVRSGIQAADEDSEIQVFRDDLGSPAFFDIKNGIIDAINKVDFEDIDGEEINEALIELSRETIGPITGLPIKRGFDVWEGVNDIIEEDEAAKGVWKLLGWSPWLVDKQAEEE